MRRILSAGLLALACASLSGCAAYDRMVGLDGEASGETEAAAENAKQAQVFPFVQMAPEPPPPVQYEPRPDLMAMGGDQWRPGYWTYNGRTFIWNDGTVIQRPHPTARWTADRWEHRKFGWAFVPGYWQ